MNFSQKLKLYRYWDEKQVNENEISECDFENAYKKKFLNYFRKYYAEGDLRSSITLQFISKNDEIMHSNNVMNINWFKNNQQLLHEDFYLNNHDKLIYRVTKMFVIYAANEFRMTFQSDNDERIMRRFIQNLRKWRKMFFFARYFRSKWNVFLIWYVEFVVEIVHKLHQKLFNKWWL